MPHLIDLAPDEITARMVVDAIRAGEQRCDECGQVAPHVAIITDGDEGRRVCADCLERHEAYWRMRQPFEEAGE